MKNLYVKILVLVTFFFSVQLAFSDGWFDPPIVKGTEFHEVSSKGALEELVSKLKNDKKIIIDIESYIPRVCKKKIPNECIYYRALSTENPNKLDWAVLASMSGNQLKGSKAKWREFAKAGMRITDIEVVPRKDIIKAKDKGGTDSLHYWSSPDITILMVEDREKTEWYFFYDINELKFDELMLDYAQEKNLAVTAFQNPNYEHYNLMVQNGKEPQFTSNRYVVFTKDHKGRQHEFKRLKGSAYTKNKKEMISLGYRPYFKSRNATGWIKDNSQKVKFGSEVTDECSWYKGQVQMGLTYSLIDMDGGLWALPGRQASTKKPGRKNK